MEKLSVLGITKRKVVNSFALLLLNIIKFLKIKLSFVIYQKSYMSARKIMCSNIQFVIDCTIEKRIILYVIEKTNYRKIIEKYILTSLLKSINMQLRIALVTGEDFCHRSVKYTISSFPERSRTPFAKSPN